MLDPLRAKEVRGVGNKKGINQQKEKRCLQRFEVVADFPLHQSWKMSHQKLVQRGDSCIRDLSSDNNHSLT